MPYTHTTFAAAKTLLAARLGDPNKVFWVDAELGFALVEARRMWNAVTLHDRTTGTFSTTENQAFYQLATSMAALRGQTITDQSLVSEIEYHLVERQGLVSWAGTTQFTLNQILTAVQRRRDKFLADTACAVVEREDVILAGESVVDLDDSVVGVRRAVYRDISGAYASLRSSDARMFATPNTPREGTPQAYGTATDQNLRVRLFPTPRNTGHLKTFVVKTGATLTLAGTGVVLGVPNDLAWGIKYGALADLLRDFDSVDSLRSEAAEQLYTLAVQLGKQMPVLLGARIDGATVQPAAISSTDSGSNGWQGKGTGKPKTVSVIAPDCLALTPVPDSNPHTVELDLVRNATVPSVDTDYLDIGREQLDALLGMAQRICLFKVGGQELTDAEPLLAKFFEEAQAYSLRRSAASASLQAITRPSARAIEKNPWLREPQLIDDVGEEVVSERNARRRPIRK